MRHPEKSCPGHQKKIRKKLEKNKKRTCINEHFMVVYRHWGISAVGSAFEWHSKGRGFESHMLHFYFLQIWFIGRTLASQAGKAGSTPVICCIETPCSRWVSDSCKGFFVVLRHALLKKETYASPVGGGTENPGTGRPCRKHLPNPFLMGYNKRICQ